MCIGRISININPDYLNLHLIMHLNFHYRRYNINFICFSFDLRCFRYLNELRYTALILAKKALSYRVARNIRRRCGNPQSESRSAVVNTEGYVCLEDTVKVSPNSGKSERAYSWATLTFILLLGFKHRLRYYYYISHCVVPFLRSRYIRTCMLL